VGLLVLLALVVGVVLSVRFAANLVGAKNGTWSIIFSLLAQAALGEVARRLLFDNSFVQFIAALAGGALAYSLLLDTTFVKGIIISVVSSILILGCFLVLGASLAMA